MADKDKSVKTGKEWGSDTEVIELSWVCLACGYVEKIVPHEEGTPARSKECPVCGAMMSRMNAFETFHLGFTDKTSSDFPVSGFKVISDPPLFSPSLPMKRDKEVVYEPPLTVNDILGIKVQDSVYHFVTRGSQNLRERFTKLVASLREDQKFDRANDFLKSEAVLFSKDGKPFGGTQYGVFGNIVSDKTFADRYSRGFPFTLQEAREQSIQMVSDNDWTLRIRVNESVMDFQPKPGFPFDRKQVSHTVFEDFVRRYRNLESTPGSALAFLKSAGNLTAVNSVPVNRKKNLVFEGVRVLPSEPDKFKDIICGLNARGILWEGDCDGIFLREGAEKVQGIIKKLDTDAVVETTGSADVNPGFVIRKDMYPNFGKFEDVIKKSLSGKVAKINMSGSGGLSFEYPAENTIENQNEAQNLVIQLGDPFPTILHEDGHFKVSLSISLDQMNFPTQGTIMEEKPVKESYQYVISYLCSNIFEKRILEEEVEKHSDMQIQEAYPVFEGYRVRILLNTDRVLTEADITETANTLMVLGGTEMIKIKSVKKMVESVSETEWDRARDFAKSLGDDLLDKSPRETVEYLDRKGYELYNSEFMAETLPDLYQHGRLWDSIRHLARSKGISFSPDGKDDYSYKGLYTGIGYGPNREKVQIASLLSGKTLEDYNELRSLLKKHSSWIKESKNVAKGKKRRIVEEEDEMPIRVIELRYASAQGEWETFRNIEAYASSGEEINSISIGLARDGVKFDIDFDADDVVAAIREYARKYMR